MNRLPKISIIMPVHNGEKYIRAAIDSILKQSFKDFEFLIIDDCSTDESPKIVNSYSDERIRLIVSEDRLKLAGALNLGMEQAKGDFIARMDCDDISLPERLQCQFNFLRENKDIGICGTWVQLFPKQNQKIQTYPTDRTMVHALTLFHSPFAHPSVMMRRALFDQNSLRYDIDYYPTEDFDLWTRALTYFTGVNLNEVLLHYRVHGQSLTGSDWNNMDEQAARITQRGLQNLELPADSDSSRFHRKIAMGQISQTTEALTKTAIWLKSIAEANLYKRIYDHPSLLRIMEDIWFRNCMHCNVIGSWSFRYFLQYRFRSYPSANHVFTLAASSFKNSLKRKVI